MPTCCHQILTNLPVMQSQHMGGGNFLLELDTSSYNNFTVLPGQFATFSLVEEDQSSAFAFRRPFSIYDQTSRSLRFIYQIKGKITEKLSHLKPGDLLNVHFPLGNSFAHFISPDSQKIILVAGGIGISPMYMLAQYLLALHKTVQLVYGARNSDSLVEIETFQKLGLSMVMTTDDGSLGMQGTVIDGLKTISHEDIDLICSCGPEKMMFSVAHFAENHAIPCLVSLEKTMACGTGSCMGCVVETSSRGFIPTCLEGPVVDAADIKW